MNVFHRFNKVLLAKNKVHLGRFIDGDEFQIHGECSIIFPVPEDSPAFWRRCIFYQISANFIVFASLTRTVNNKILLANWLEILYLESAKQQYTVFAS